MKILQVVDSLNEGTGGTSYSVSEVADTLAASGCEVRLLSQNYPALGPLVHPKFADARITVAKPIPFRLGSLTTPFLKELNESASWASLIHANGLWLPTNRVTRNASVKYGKPLVISPRGMFEVWSRSYKAFRKRVAWQLFEKQNLQTAVCLHATSEEEADTLRTCFNTPIAVIPNGVEIPNADEFPDRSILEARFPALQGRRWLLFLSRLHPKKGIPELLHAWKNIEKEFPDCHLLIAGGDEDNYQSKLEDLAHSLNLQERMTFLGNIVGEEKASAFANSSLFVLPSYSENFGRVIAEALSFGVPVIATKGTPWSLLEKEDCGWWIDLSALETTLREALRKEAPLLREMGARGRKVVMERFGWNAIAAQFVALYHWILKMDAHPPDSVRMN
ncbi:MAG: glycosyltransferase [Chthoniobacterales bacterium]